MGRGGEEGEVRRQHRIGQVAGGEERQHIAHFGQRGLQGLLDGNDADHFGADHQARQLAIGLLGQEFHEAVIHGVGRRMDRRGTRGQTQFTRIGRTGGKSRQRGNCKQFR
ncbi:hypothetical protein D3C71_1711510 [compost metagenome]